LRVILERNLTTGKNKHALVVKPGRLYYACLYVLLRVTFGR